MWILAMFDLPTSTKVERADMTRFRKALLSIGFFRVQYSVYARYCDNMRLTDTVLNSVKGEVPPKGEVRIIYVTDKQYGDMYIFEGVKKKKPEPEPEQLLFF